MVALLNRTASPRVAPEKRILSNRYLCLVKVTRHALPSLSIWVLPLLRRPMPLRVSRSFFLAERTPVAGSSPVLRMPYALLLIP